MDSQFPVWIVWLLAAAFAWPVLLREPDGKGSRRSWIPWAPAAVLAVVAGLMTFEDTRVSKDELYEAALRVSERYDGAVVDPGAVMFEFDVSYMLEHKLVMETTQDDEWQPGTDYTVELRPEGADESGPAVCIDVQFRPVSRVAHDVYSTHAAASRQPCGGDEEIDQS